jgi:hypothetical protein
MQDSYYVFIHKVWRSSRRQTIPFYDAVLYSQEIEFRGRLYNGVFIEKLVHARALKKRGKGWTEITEDWFKYKKELEEKKKLEEKKNKLDSESHEPVKRKRGRPRKKRD